MVMNESFSDLSVLGNFTTNQPYLSFFNSLTKNTIRGYANSSVYGGYTANSEFEFLTGCTKAFLPGSPYLQYIKDSMPTLITNITAQEGYAQAQAVHPYRPSGYNRNRIYPLLGFDRFLSLQDFVNPVKVRKYISDESDYEMLEQLYEEKETGSSLCLFNVTMQNHSDYKDSKYVFDNPVTLDTISLQPEAEQYLSLVKLSDDALKQLVTYLEGVDEPVLLVVFGDHQPHLPDLFYKTVMGKMPDDLTGEEAMKRYLVPFLIWANYDIGETEVEHISLNYLSTLMMETAGLELTDFQKFLLDMYQYIPSLSAQGYYDNKGELHSWDETENDVIQWIQEYRIVQYNYLFDTKHRLESHFQVKGK
jgi:phosphoglycerol transferase MdoB-like AlkP superfamily enzyme